MIICLLLILRKTQFVCGLTILTAGLFVNELSSDVGISFRRVVWITTHCCFMRNIFPKLKMVKVKKKFAV